MYIQRFKRKFDVFKLLGRFPSFKSSVGELGASVAAIEKTDGIFNAVAVLDKSETSDLFFKRETVSICEIETKYDCFKVLTYSMVGYDLIDSKQLVIFNITHLSALKFYLGQNKVVFRSNDLYNSLNKEEARVLRRQRAIRYGNFSKTEETTSELEYADENGYLAEFVENNASEVYNWVENSNYGFSNEKDTEYGFSESIEVLMEVLREEDNSMSSKTKIEDYNLLNSGFERGKTSKSKYNTKDGVVRETPKDMLSDRQLRRNRLIRENFRRYKHSMRSMDKLLTRKVKMGEYEHFLRLFKEGKRSVDEFADDMSVFHQMENAELEAEEMGHWLLYISDLLTSAEVRMKIWLDLAINGQIEGYMEFVSAKELAEQAEQAERD